MTEMFWADGSNNEQEIWLDVSRTFLTILNNRFLSAKHMCQKYSSCIVISVEHFGRCICIFWSEKWLPFLNNGEFFEWADVWTPIFFWKDKRKCHHMIISSLFIMFSFAFPMDLLVDDPWLNSLFSIVLHEFPLHFKRKRRGCGDSEHKKRGDLTKLSML